jgi:integrase
MEQDGQQDLQLANPDRHRALLLEGLFYRLGPIPRFPDSLVAEIEAHLRRVSGQDILADLNVRPLKPGSIRTRRHQLGAYLSGVVLSGEDPANIKSLADAVEVARVRKGLRFFLDRADNRSTSQAHDVAQMLVSIARHEVKVQEAQLDELRAFCKRLDDGGPGMSDRNKSRLRQFDDTENVRNLVSLPSTLVTKAKKEVAKENGRVTQAAALIFQSALAIELLLMIPMRRENLTRLNIERHIDRRRNGRVYIFIAGSEVKNGVDIEAELPQSAVKILDEYMTKYHPVLAQGGSPWIFPGLPGRPKSRERMALQISETIKKQIGLEVNVHLFRHIAAKLYLDRNVGAYGVVQKLHGHKSIETTIRSYCGMEAKSATAHYDSQILQLREQGRGTPGAGRSGPV